MKLVLYLLYGHGIGNGVDDRCFLYSVARLIQEK